jgi:hypothetical protein
MKPKLRFAFFGLTLLLLSCNGDSGTNDDQSPMQVNIGLHHVGALDTVLEASLFVDGTQIDHFSSNVGTDPVGLDGTVANVSAGRHEIKVVIIRQTTSPNEYLFNGSVFFEGRQILITPIPQGTLATGESLSAFVDL